MRLWQVSRTSISLVWVLGWLLVERVLGVPSLSLLLLWQFIRQVSIGWQLGGLMGYGVALGLLHQTSLLGVWLWLVAWYGSLVWLQQLGLQRSWLTGSCTLLAVGLFGWVGGCSASTVGLWVVVTGLSWWWLRRTHRLTIYV